MPFGHSSVALDEAAPGQLLDRLHALTQLPRRAEVLGIQLTTLRQLMTHCFVMVDLDDDADYAGHATIVVAQDHPALRAIAAEILEELSCRVIVTDGRLAELPKEIAVDAILLDVTLVNEEQLARVRHVAQRSSRIVVATSLPEGPGRQRLRDAGAVGFVAWPLDRRELARCLRRVLIPAPIKSDACSG